VTVVDGRAIAAEVMESVRNRASVLRDAGVQPHLCFITIGESPPAQMYASRLERLGRQAGITVSRRPLAHDATLSVLDSTVATLNDDRTVDGILVQMPLPPHLTYADLAEIIDPRKDVDGITLHNGGLLYLGLPGHPPSTASAMMHILDAIGVDPSGMNSVVVGRSNVVGHPVAELLLARDATVTVTHRKTGNLARHTREADILMVGAGEPHLIGADMIKAGAIVVDAGINASAGGVVGDVAFEECKEVASVITPVPGGVGPVTNAVLLRNLVTSAEQRGGDGLVGSECDVRGRIQRLMQDGADLVDIGGESTRPGFTPVPEREELRRVAPAIATAVDLGVPVSVDTSKSTVAGEAMRLGARMVNDISGLADPNMASTVAEGGAWLVVVHRHTLDNSADVISSIVRDLIVVLGRAVRGGVSESKIVIDPGFGFGKSWQQNLAVVRQLHRLREIGRPILIGPSRKGTISRVLGVGLHERLEGTIALTVACVAGGADLVRVHDVKEVRRAVTIVDALVRPVVSQ
jgi:methylenetetrahydrofolate dehydrogenase (NADP+) / methenyltetrahydrofolate cyclohydrolase